MINELKKRNKIILSIRYLSSRNYGENWYKNLSKKNWKNRPYGQNWYRYHSEDEKENNS